jgi:hypothetical protein
MLYRTRRAAAAIACVSLLGPTALAGCSSGSNATVTHNPPLSTFGGKSTARSAVQTAILVSATSNGIAVANGPTPANIARRVLDVMHGRRISAATGPCTNRSKTSQVTNTDGSVTTTTDLYYDAACASLEEEQVITVTTPGDPVTSASGTVTTFSTAAAVTSYHKLSITATNTPSATVGGPSSQSVTYNDAASLTVGGAVVAAVGATCTGAPNSPTMNCTAAMFGTAGSATFGQALSDTGTAGTGGAQNSVVVSVTYFGSGITGIGQASGNWGVSGAPGFNTGSGNYKYTTTGSSGTGTFSLTDALYTYTVTGTLTAAGLAVTIVRNTDPIATATVDVAGNGIITYADGSTDVIWGEVVDA